MRSTLLCLAVVAFQCFADDAASPPLEFKGVRIGATQAEFLAVHTGFRCMADKTDAEITLCATSPSCFQGRYTSKQQCEREFAARNTFGGEPSKFIMATMWQGKLHSVSVEIEPESYDRLARALAAKYGTPEETREPITTRAGVSYENALARWNFPEGFIHLRRFSGRIDEGLATIMSRELAVRAAARRKAASNAAPSDL